MTLTFHQDNLGVTSLPRRGASTSFTLTSPHRHSVTPSADRRAAARTSSPAAPTHFYQRLDFSLKDNLHRIIIFQSYFLRPETGTQTVCSVETPRSQPEVSPC